AWFIEKYVSSSFIWGIWKRTCSRALGIGGVQNGNTCDPSTGNHVQVAVLFQPTRRQRLESVVLHNSVHYKKSMVPPTCTKDQLIDKASNTTQSVKDSANQAGQTVMDKAHGTADAVKNATGMK
ncbi:hypothetical protein IFM89_022562, partial [Coptis chinensis]